MYISEIQKRLMDIINRGGQAKYNRVLGLVMYHGANPKEMTDSYHIALWIEGAPLNVRQEFLSEFDNDGAITICDYCGKWMIEGYSVYGDPYCSEECAIGSYVRDVFNADSDDNRITEEQAETMFKSDLELHQDEVFWTQWY